MLASLLDYLDGLYPEIRDKSEFKGKKTICHIILSVLYHLNNFLCWYYHYIDRKKIHSPESCDYVVSLTTYPARVGNVWKVIEMAAHQKGIKDKYAICLYLIKDEFKGIELPKKIKELQARGLTIKFEDENLRCHNKYFYAFKDFPEKTIITIDDDLQYNHYSISGLIKTGKRFPSCIVYNWGCGISKEMPYNDWKAVKNSPKPVSDNLPLGVGGVLYPPHSCNDLVKRADVITQTCLKADDLWLNFNSRLDKTLTIWSGIKSSFLVLPDSNQQTALYKENMDSVISGNDVQIDNISTWSMTNLGCDYFVNV